MKTIIMSDLKELANKQFATEEECKKAEDEILVKREEKEKASLARKEEAKVVEDAYKARNKVYEDREQALEKIYSTYREEVTKLIEQRNAAIDAEDKKAEEANKAYNKALDEFTKKHPEGYHMTLKDGDHTVTITKSHNHNDVMNVFDEMANMADNFLKNFWF